MKRYLAVEIETGTEDSDESDRIMDELAEQYADVPRRFPSSMPGTTVGVKQVWLAFTGDFAECRTLTY
jgi:hypothetical protein